MAELLDYASGRSPRSNVAGRRIRRTVTTGVIVSLGGVVLRLAARTLSPRTMGWSPGSWDATDWAFWEHAWADVGCALLLGGIILVGFGLSAWCREREA